ncbi:MAG: SDR family oxidoreductase [Bryobacterales bacterium]|nr:SDR family oxidoreductase [Bryobacterales bacterium]
MTRRNRALLWGSAGLTAGLAINAAIRLRFMLDMRGDVVLITGGSRGLGLALAREFAGLGCRVAICARKQDELDIAKHDLERRGAEVFAGVCDVSKESEVVNLIQAVRARFGRIDHLINNAGIIRVAPVANMTLDDFRYAMDVMFWGVVYPTLHVLDEMKHRGRGRIANVTSIGGKVSVPHLLPYCCAKFAAVGFSEGLRAELARHGVKVITIAPGLMRTGSYRQAEFKGNHQQEAAWFSISSSLPLMSMGAERAARQIVAAVRRGDSEKILSTQASLLARANGAFPGFIPNLMAAANRFLPHETFDRESIVTGAQAEQHAEDYQRRLTRLGRRAAERLNEMTETRA